MNVDEIKKDFEKHIFGYIFNDIQNCIKAKANYTVALALVSYTEFLGGLITGTLGIPGKGCERFKAALKYFEWNGDISYYESFKVKFKDIDPQIRDGDIYKLFRCGLAHEYFIKGDSFVHNNPDGCRDKSGVFHCEGCIPDDAGVQVHDEGAPKRLRFHTNAYFRDFKEAWIKYYSDLIDACENDNNRGLLDCFINSRERISVREIRW